MKEEQTSARWMLASLVALLLVTRLAREVLGVHLPDAAVPTFFLAGCLGLGSRSLAVLLLAAVGVDLVQFALGASTACVSPGYPLLFVAYAVSWGTGALCQSAKLSWKAAAVLLTGVVAFALTSGGYYYLSGKFPQPAFAEFVVRSQRYLPDYMINVLLYAGPGLLLVEALQRTAGRERA
ncbi:MAG: hypothetical protein QM778_06070 [Myxococcales bacterium]